MIHSLKLFKKISLLYLIFGIPQAFALSLTEGGYQKMIKTITCYQVLVENLTNYPIMVETIQIAPKQRAIVYEQCLNEYERTSRSLGYTQDSYIKFDALINGKSYTLLNLADGMLSHNYLFRITQNNDGTIQIEESSPQSPKYETLSPHTVPATGGRKVFPPATQAKPEILSPGEPVEFDDD